MRWLIAGPGSGAMAETILQSAFRNAIHKPTQKAIEEGAGMSHRLHADAVTLRYQARVISQDLSLAIPDGSFTAIVGPNACGKSTLLRALSRLLVPDAGQVVLDGKAISALPSREVARKLGLLPQSPVAPDGLTVAELVARGRFPHQSFLRQWSPDDERAVRSALEATGTLPLAERPVAELSGGQRQRVWIAMTLAQETDILLLDEPTTFLDIVHQVELLELLAGLNAQGRTVVAVLHELNLAFRYASHLVAMCEGAVVAEGAPETIVTDQLMRQVFGLDALVQPDPLTGRPMVIPRPRR
jgi:iron complex transport system ATP-binding protein